MGLPTAIESDDRLTARYREAVLPLIVAEHVASGKVKRPGEFRRHVFDCENGVRLIVSRERLIDGRVGVHFSGSFHDPEKAGRLCASEPKLMDPIQAAMKIIFVTWQRIAGSKRSAEVLGISENGVIHYFVPEGN